MALITVEEAEELRKAKGVFPSLVVYMVKREDEPADLYIDYSRRGLAKHVAAGESVWEASGWKAPTDYMPECPSTHIAKARERR